MMLVVDKLLGLGGRPTSVYVMLAACILVSLGSLRGLIGAGGYWALWAAVVWFAWGEVKKSRGILFDHGMVLVTSAFVLFGSGFFISATVNKDGYTWYQAAKLFCIYMVYVSLWVCSRSISAQQFYRVSKIVVFAGAALFLCSKFLVPEYYVLLGDGRQGSRLAYPGVLWKTSIFFSIFVLEKMLNEEDKSFGDMACIALAVFLLIADSSRTGLMLGLLIYGCLISVRYKYKSLKVGFVLVLIVVVLYLLTLNVSDPEAQFVDGYPVVFDRLLQVDEVRFRLLSEGWVQARQCFVTGCGFGATLSDVAGEPVVVHNAYLAALSDLGIIGFAGFTLLMLMPIIIYMVDKHRRYEAIDCCGARTQVAAMLGGVGYGIVMMLHPMSSELSEWGIWIIMVSRQASWYSRDSGSSHARNNFE